MARMLGTHSLIHPIELETRTAGAAEPTVEELKPAGFCVTIRRPKAKDMRVFDRHGVSITQSDGSVHERTEMIAAMTEMIVQLSNLDELAVANLDAEDFTALGNVVEKIVPAGPATGQT